MMTSDLLVDLSGWIYTVAWCVCFYPQIYINWKRRSVVGLNLDYTVLNVVGFIMYSLFNSALLWSPQIQDEYFRLHPGGVNPVQLNDVYFSLHATGASAICLLQCLVYERGDQQLTPVTRMLLAYFGLSVTTVLLLATYQQVTWLLVLYYCSYIKLFITFIKYIPQVVMNYRRKTTDGWSIETVLLDLVGGVFSLIQMVLLAYRSGDWGSILGDPTKLGLGVISVGFDVLFTVQHYILYR